jgi:hypothetical protein
MGNSCVRKWPRFTVSNFYTHCPFFDYLRDGVAGLGMSQSSETAAVNMGEPLRAVRCGGSTCDLIVSTVLLIQKSDVQ